MLMKPIEQRCILHVCGGDPFCIDASNLFWLYSPRMWRWSPIICIQLGLKIVFSTYVEVIPMILFLIGKAQGILHVCGGDPRIAMNSRILPKYSPRMWRWSLSTFLPWPVEGVFSTYVEVILLVALSQHKCSGILHVCGGDPNTRVLYILLIVYSPRMWRWSWQAPTIHFSWCCILHVCGGDPTSLQVIHGDHLVFSTYVEVILMLQVQLAMNKCILHVCGGDPEFSL